ncbi:MAG: hypothetical protein ACI808_002069 [Paraglaciecola sp.]|jgi:hypothetical protein
MTIEQENEIDIISTYEEEGYVGLTISDHLDWDIANEKLLKLQNKINTYLGFVQSGQIYNDYPNAKRLKIKIELVCKYPPNEEGEKFLKLLQAMIEKAGFYFNWKLHGSINS